MLAISDQEGSIISEVFQWKTAVDQSVKDEPPFNASLIASAPDLLEALDEAMSMLGSRLMKDTFGYEWHKKSIAAIAKAKGEAQ